MASASGLPWQRCRPTTARRQPLSVAGFHGRDDLDPCPQPFRVPKTSRRVRDTRLPGSSGEENNLNHGTEGELKIIFPPMPRVPAAYVTSAPRRACPPAPLARIRWPALGE